MIGENKFEIHYFLIYNYIIFWNTSLKWYYENQSLPAFKSPRRGYSRMHLLFFHTDQIIKKIRRWIECMHPHMCRFARNRFLLNYHNVGIAVYWFDGPLDTPEAKPRWMECRFAYIAMRCGTRNLQFATNWLKHKADRFHKWNNQGAKGNRSKAVSHKPLHGGKNRKKWNLWLHWQKY